MLTNLRQNLHPFKTFSPIFFDILTEQVKTKLFCEFAVHTDCKNFKSCKEDGLKVGKFVHSFVKTLLKAKSYFMNFENT